MSVVANKYRGSREYGLAYMALISAAHVRGMVTYKGIAILTDLPQNGDRMGKEVGHLVGEISEDEVKRGRPMLSALAVEKDTGIPSDGFFNLAADLGLFSGKSRTERKKFASKEKAKLYELWR
jgi:hypothetical protein